jgi:hypothetical protein
MQTFSFFPFLMIGWRVMDDIPASLGTAAN